MIIPLTSDGVTRISLQVLNKTTVYQRLQDIFSQYQDVKHAQDTATKELVGQVNVADEHVKKNLVLFLTVDCAHNLQF